MDLVKSNFAKKLILVLVVIIVFNAVMPKQVMAADWDIGGLLFKPLISLAASIIGTLDVLVGWVMIDVNTGFNTDLLACLRRFMGWQWIER